MSMNRRKFLKVFGAGVPAAIASTAALSHISDHDLLISEEEFNGPPLIDYGKFGIQNIIVYSNTERRMDVISVVSDIQWDLSENKMIEKVSSYPGKTFPKDIKIVPNPSSGFFPVNEKSKIFVSVINFDGTIQKYHFKPILGDKGSFKQIVLNV